MEDVKEFICRECGRCLPVSDRGDATLNGEPIDVCIDCCVEEQKKQHYADM